MDVLEFAAMVLDNLPYEPTSQQVELVAALARFCSKSTPSDTVFMLNGYAGTGKTSLCASLVATLNAVGIGTVLLAPTGRAAKVFSSFAGQPAYTIHRRIYSVSGTPLDESRRVAVAENRSRNTVFVVDEASMIGADAASGHLLEDLVHYVYSGVNCRLILLGDTAQLPPVGCEESPALSVKELKGLGLRVNRAVLTATVRQAYDSGILYNATRLRRAMTLDPLPEPLLTVSPFPDVTAVDGEEMEDTLAEAIGRDGIKESIIITRSNSRATRFNLAVRTRILYSEEELCKGDLLLVGKNNYYWSRDVKGLDFIANGDTCEVERVYGVESRFGHRFADVRLRLADRDLTLDCKIMLDTLTSDDAAMSRAAMVALFDAIVADDPARSADAIRSPYLNALQVKYAYAVTCHKAQGGQWANVFVDLGYIPPESIGIDFYRWLYTAITRATRRLYLLNPSIALR